MTNVDQYYREGAKRKSKRKVYGKILFHTNEYFKKYNVKESCYITTAGRDATDVVWIMRRFNGAIKAIYSAELSSEIYRKQTERMKSFRKEHASTHFSTFKGNENI